MVGREDHDDVGLLDRLGRREHAQALGLGLGSRLFEPSRQADADVDAGVAQGQRVRVALAAVAEHRDVLALDQGQVGVVVVEHLSHGGLSFVVALSGGCVRGRVGRQRRGGPGHRGSRRRRATATGRRVRSLIERRAAADRDHAGLDELADAERLEHAQEVARACRRCR